MTFSVASTLVVIRVESVNSQIVDASRMPLLICKHTGELLIQSTNMTNGLRGECVYGSFLLPLASLIFFLIKPVSRFPLDSSSHGLILLELASWSRSRPLFLILFFGLELIHVPTSIFFILERARGGRRERQKERRRRIKKKKEREEAKKK